MAGLFDLFFSNSSNKNHDSFSGDQNLDNIRGTYVGKDGNVYNTRSDILRYDSGLKSSNSRTCPSCNGSGYRFSVRCNTCNGTGRDEYISSGLFGHYKSEENNSLW